MIFVPQIYGIPGQGRRPNDTDPDVADYMDTVLAYNEPNQPDQADISPEDAIDDRMVEDSAKTVAKSSENSPQKTQKIR